MTIMLQEISDLDYLLISTLSGMCTGLSSTL